MAYTTIDDPSAHFHTQLWTGNGSNPRNITNDANAGDFQPDIIWKKRRDNTSDFAIWDSSRTAPNASYTNEATDEIDDDAMNAFQSDGWQINSNGMNTNTATYVAWQWKVNGGTTSSNSDGSTTSTVQANTTAGCSIVLLATGSAGSKTYGHGLGAAPEFIIIIDRTADESRMVYHKGVANSDQHDKNLQLENTGALDTTTDGWGTAVPTSTVFGVNSSQLLETDQNCVAYLWTPIKGYSHFGRYEGSGDADGPFVYTGFKPAFVLIKRIDGTENWAINDNKRTAYNPRAGYLSPDSSGAETSAAVQDFLSNGFKIRQTGSVFNTSGDTYIYAAFAEQPFVTSGGVPCTAG